MKRIYMIPSTPQRRMKYPFDILKAGDRLGLSEDKVNSCLTAGRAWAKRNNSPLMFERAEEEDGTVFIVAKETDDAERGSTLPPETG